MTIKTLDIPPMRDPCWRDPDWRDRMLRKACDLHCVDFATVADMTGVKINTARLWFSKHRDVIPANHLRGLLHDLNGLV